MGRGAHTRIDARGRVEVLTTAGWLEAPALAGEGPAACAARVMLERAAVTPAGGQLELAGDQLGLPGMPAPAPRWEDRA